MELSRRDFRKFSGVGTGALALLKGLGSTSNTLVACGALLVRKRIGEKATICPYNTSGCGFLVAAENG